MMVAAFVGGMGYPRRTSVTAGLNMGQISEFSLILAALGMSLGHIDGQTMGLITLIGLITIGLSTYMILYSDWIYDKLSPAFAGIRLGKRAVVSAPAGTPAADIIVFGLGLYGRNIVQELERRGFSVLGVDHDPDRVRYWQTRGIEAIYGDLEDMELFHALPLAGAKWVVSSIPGQDKARVLVHALWHHGFNGQMALTAETRQHRDALLSEGAHVVLLPFRDAAAEAADRLARH